MDKLQDLKEQLSAIETRISNIQIDESFYENMTLLNKRVLLGKKIARLEWNKLSAIDKEKKREQDFNLTEKFFQKYPDDVKNQYLYKTQFILLIKKVKILADADSVYKLLFRALLTVLDSANFINIHDNGCIKALFEQIQAEGNETITEVLNIYKILLDIPFEIVGME